MTTEKDHLEASDIEQVSTIDYSLLTVQNLIQELKSLSQESVKETVKPLKGIKEAYDYKFYELRQQALHQFIEDGGHKDDFEFRIKPEFKLFEEEYAKQSKIIKDYFSELEETKIANFKRKKLLLTELRDIVDGEESKDSFKRVKEIQDEWNNIKVLPSSAERQETWSNYKAILDRYYNNRSIYFDLKTLDRQKNKKLKLALCEKAEGLIKSENLNNAFEELNKLHHEFKTIGPVPDEVNEEVWQRFKTATDAFHERRKDFIESFKAVLQENGVKKIDVIIALRPYADKVSESIDEWKTWTKEVLAIQEDWKKIGQVPYDKVKEINKLFWDTAKVFFENKRKFFKKLDRVRADNLNIKKQLCEQVEKIVEEELNELLIKNVIQVQKDWKKVGPVPRAYNEKIYTRFKNACDAVFNKRREQQKEVDASYEKNHEVKLSILDQIKALTEEKLGDFEGLVDAWNDAGFVPRDKVKNVQQLFKDTCDEFLNGINTAPEQVNKLRLHVELGGLKGHPNASKIINEKKIKLRTKIQGLKSDIDTLANNVEFFARSKNADQIREEAAKKIAEAEGKISEIKKQVKMYDAI